MAAGPDVAQPLHQGHHLLAAPGLRGILTQPFPKDGVFQMNVRSLVSDRLLLTY